MTLVEFLRARADARELDADCIHSTGCMQIRWDGLCDCGEPERVRREVAAKRRTIEEHQPGGNYVYRDDGTQACGTCGDYTVEWPCDTLYLLAMPDADHADYQQEWALTPA